MVRRSSCCQCDKGNSFPGLFSFLAVSLGAHQPIERKATRMRRLRRRPRHTSFFSFIPVGRYRRQTRERRRKYSFDASTVACSSRWLHPSIYERYLLFIQPETTTTLARSPSFFPFSHAPSLPAMPAEEKLDIFFFFPLLPL